MNLDIVDRVLQGSKRDCARLISIVENESKDYEKYLNSVNTVSVVRSKLAYLLYIKGEKDKFNIFYKKGIREANKGQIKGLNAFEIKLFEKMKEDFEKLN